MNRIRYALFCDGANGETVVTATIAAPAADVVEVEAVRVVAVVLVQRSRPVAAVKATAVEARTVTAARSGKKNTFP